MLLHIVFLPHNIYNEPELTVTFFFLFCNFATLGVSCSMWDLHCTLWDLWLHHVESSSLPRNRTQAPPPWECRVLTIRPSGKSLLLQILGSFA